MSFDFKNNGLSVIKKQLGFVIKHILLIVNS